MTLIEHLFSLSNIGNKFNMHTPEKQPKSKKTEVLKITARLTTYLI
jgi:hypothetical protein